MFSIFWCLPVGSFVEFDPIGLSVPFLVCLYLPAYLFPSLTCLGLSLSSSVEYVSLCGIFRVGDLFQREASFLLLPRFVFRVAFI